MPNIHEFKTIENFRDLGGYPCRYGTTGHHIIYRSATPVFGSKEELDQIAALGIASVIDLREDKTKAEYPNPFAAYGLPVTSLNVNGNGRIPVDHEDQIDSYFEMLEDPESARKIFLAILNAPKPVLIHCNAGKDRTGVFSAVLLLLNGVSMDAVNADYMLSFDLLPRMTIEAKKNNLPSILIERDPNYIPEFFDRFLHRYGTFADYFEAIGISDDDFNGLSNILGKQEYSCGAVVFHDGKLLVEHMAKGHYSLPKGHQEEGETDEETAKREIKEETGLLVSLVSGFEFATNFSPKEGAFKRVRWFIAETSFRDLKVQKEEVQDAYWLSPSDACMVLSHDSDREVVRQACRFYFID